MESDEDAAEPLEPILPAAQCYQDLLRSLGGGHALKKLREVTMLAENADAETRIFERYDHDGSGDIDKEELRAALEEIGILDFDSASAEAVMAKYDADRSGTLELAEFRLLVKELRLVASEKKVFEQDIARLKTRLRNQSRGLLDPKGDFVQYWDMVTAGALMFTMFVTPYEVGLNLRCRRTR